MGFSYRLSQEMWVIVTPRRVGVGTPLIIKGQMPVFFNQASAEEFPKICRDVPSEHIFVGTKTWEEVLNILTFAKSLGADSLSFYERGQKPKAADLAETISHIQDIVTGKHDGNLTNPN